MGSRPCCTHRPSQAPPQPFGLLSTMPPVWSYLLHTTLNHPNAQLIVLRNAVAGRLLGQTEMAGLAREPPGSP